MSLQRKVDTPCAYYLKEDNKIIIKFINSIDDQAIANMSIPKKIRYQIWFLQKVQNDYTTKIGLFQRRKK